MGYKIYKSGNYIKVIDTTTEELYNGHAKTVFVDKSNVNKAEYKILNIKDLPKNTILKIGEIFKENDSSYSQLEWETFYENETGNFNLPQAGGEILNIGSNTSPDTSKPNTIQYNDLGNIWIIDSDGVAVSIDALSSLGYTPENVVNKSTDIEADKTSDIKYPTVKAVYDWANNLFVKVTDLATTLTNYATSSYVNSGLANKVDKVTGYGLSKNDFTDLLKSKLDSQTTKFVNVTRGSGVTGTTTEFIAGYILVPANTIKQLDMLNLFCRITKSGSSGTAIVRIRKGISLNISTSQILGSVSAATNAQSIPLNKKIEIRDTNLATITANNVSDTVIITNDYNQQYSIDRTVDNYFFITIIPSSISDTFYFESIQIN